MSKKILISVIVVCLVVGGLVGYVATKNKLPAKVGLQTNIYNIIDRCQNSSTTTLAGTPVKLLAYNPSRTYAAITNDSGTAVHIVISTSTFATPSAAAASMTNLGGIRLNASGGSYEILPENMTFNEVWVATSTAGQRLLIEDCPGIY